MLTVPNILTGLRLALVPVFLVCYLVGERHLAVLVFAIASGTDLFDGLLARLLNQKSALGAVLDPVADKSLGLAALLALVLKGGLPAWFLGLALLRDVVVAVIALDCKLKGIPIRAAPSRIGKYATFFTNMVVIVALIREISYAPALTGYVVALTLAAGQCLAVAAVQYVVRFRAHRATA